MENINPNEPIIWAGVVFIDVVEGLRKVLMLQEEDKDFMLIPGGKMEKGEVDHETVAREVSEELGGNVEVSNLSEEPIIVITEPSKKTGQLVEFRVFKGDI